MSAPLCKVCGGRHFGSGHIWKGVNSPVNNPAVNTEPVNSPSDRKSYMRAYMAKRRAKA